MSHPAEVPPLKVEIDVDLLTDTKRAIHHLLDAIVYDPRKYDLLGPGTESWSKLTRLAARLWGKDQDEIVSCYAPDERKLLRHRRREEAQQTVLRQHEAQVEAVVRELEARDE